MGKKTGNTRAQDLPLKIKSIYDKKLQRDGTISYLVQYRDQNVEAWAPKNYLCNDFDNKKVIQRYEMLLQMQSDSDEKLIKSRKSEQNKPHQIMKRKNIKKAKESNNKIKQQIQEIKDSNVHTKQIENKAQNFQKSLEQRKGEIEQKELQQKNNDSQKGLLKIQKQIPQNVQGSNNLQDLRIPANMKPNSGQNFKIIKAKIDQENRIQFQVKYQNGFLVWLDGDIVKNSNPLQVIRFYEKRISWGC